MPSRPQIQFVAAITVLVFALGIIGSGGTVDSHWLRFYSYAVTAAVIALTAWNRWLWRTWLGQSFGATPRHLRGTWKGTLASQWIDPTTGRSPDPKPAYLVIRQTASSVTATMLTDEMRSTSSLAEVSKVDDAASLNYIYLSRPRSHVEHRSRMHFGSTSLDISGKPATRLQGRYWTDRDSRGELDLDQRVRKDADDYESAARLFQH
jgi:hypothetical protein